MIKIIDTKIIDAQSVKFNKEFSRLSRLHDDLETSIYDMEMELSRLYKEKFEIKKQLKQIEEQIVNNCLIK